MDLHALAQKHHLCQCQSIQAIRIANLVSHSQDQYSKPKGIPVLEHRHLHSLVQTALRGNLNVSLIYHDSLDVWKAALFSAGSAVTGKPNVFLTWEIKTTVYVWLCYYNTYDRWCIRLYSLTKKQNPSGEPILN